jgi:hypothetical protein
MAENQEPKVATEDKKDSNGNKERETYTAKQVATRIGTDAKTLRKFFRSPASTIEAVGQGGRYEFDAADLPQIKKEFDGWQSGKTPRATKKADKAEAPKKREVEVLEEDEEDIELEDDPELNFDDEEEDEEEETEEPSDEDLSELEDIDLDEDEEDDEEDDEEGHSKEELESMTLPKLRMLAESDYDLDTKGLKKAQLVDAILKHEAGK